MTKHNETLSRNLNKQKQWTHKVNQELTGAGEAEIVHMGAWFRDEGMLQI